MENLCCSDISKKKYLKDVGEKNKFSGKTMKDVSNLTNAQKTAPHGNLRVLQKGFPVF